MKVRFNYGFQHKMLDRPESGRATFAKSFVTGSDFAEVQEVDPSDAPVAVRLSGPLGARSYRMLRIEMDAPPLEFRWRDGKFWIDQGPVERFAAEAAVDISSHGPFRRLKTAATSLHKVSFEAIVAEFSQDASMKSAVARLQGKVNDLISLARWDARRLMVVDGRVFEPCPEPALRFRMGLDGAKNYESFDFAPIGFEADVTFNGCPTISTGSGSTLAALIDDEGRSPEGVEVLMPETLLSDFGQGSAMRQLREHLASLADVAADLPTPYLMAVKKLFSVVAPAWSEPTQDIVAAASIFNALGPVPQAEIDTAEAARRYYNALPADKKSKEQPAGAAIIVAKAQADMPALITKMQRWLDERLYPDADDGPRVGHDGKTILRRAQTAGEVARAATIAGIDPIMLVKEARAGLADVVLVEDCDKAHARANPRDQRWFSGGYLEGTRIARAVEGAEPKLYFRRAIKEAAKEMDYPSIELQPQTGCTL